MARATDRAGIQFRVLNASKACRSSHSLRQIVCSTRRPFGKYSKSRRTCQSFSLLLMIFAVRRGGRWRANLMGLEIVSKKVVLTTGTFLGGKIHIGLEQSSGGRAGDPPSVALAGVFGSSFQGRAPENRHAAEN